MPASHLNLRPSCSRSLLFLQNNENNTEQWEEYSAYYVSTKTTGNGAGFRYSHSVAYDVYDGAPRLPAGCSC